MGLADLMGAEHGKPAPKPLAISVKAEPLDTKHAAADVMKAVKAGDVNALEDALRMFFAACDEEGESDDDEGEDDEKHGSE